MTVLKIIGVIVALVAMGIGVISFNEHCDKKFSYRFFTKISFIAAAASIWALMAGHAWYTSSVDSGGDTLNGIVIMGIGAIILLGLVYFNFRMTNLLYGLGGSALQLGLFIPLAYIGTFFVLLGLVLSIFLFAGAKPVYVINK